MSRVESVEITLALVAGLIGAGVLLAGVRVYVDPRMPNDWRVRLVTLGAALLVASAGVTLLVAWGGR